MRARRRAAHRPRDGADAPVLGPARRDAAARRLRALPVRRPARRSLALESQRHRCLVIGEDLGTVPDEVRDGARRATACCRIALLLFERDADGDFKPPARLSRAQALAVASTHDLPTLAGWWEGRDIALRGAHRPARSRRERRCADGRARERPRAAARRPGARRAARRGSAARPRAWPQLTPALADAVQAYLARTPSTLLVLQPEDVFGVTRAGESAGNDRRASQLAPQAARRARGSESGRAAASTGGPPRGRTASPRGDGWLRTSAPAHRTGERRARQRAVAPALRPRSARAGPVVSLPLAAIPRATYRVQLHAISRSPT